jgi:hypothetical protein
MCERFSRSEKFKKHLMVVHSQNIETINLDIPVLQLTNDLNKSSFEHESNHIFSTANITSSMTYNDIIINCVLEFITSLYTKPTVTEILISTTNKRGEYPCYFPVSLFYI